MGSFDRKHKSVRTEQIEEMAECRPESQGLDFEKTGPWAHQRWEDSQIGEWMECGYNSVIVIGVDQRMMPRVLIRFDCVEHGNSCSEWGIAGLSATQICKGCYSNTDQCLLEHGRGRSAIASREPTVTRISLSLDSHEQFHGNDHHCEIPCGNSSSI
jgi:hypothetical protein